MQTATQPERVLYPIFQRSFGGGQLQVSGTFWASYYGYVSMPGRTVLYLEATITASATVSSVGEMGLFSTPSGPNQAAQTLTKLSASGTLTDMTAGTPPLIIRTAALNYAVLPGTHLWVASRFACGGTQPTFAEGVSHTGLAEVLYATSIAALTGLSTVAGTSPGVITTNHGAPYIRAVED